MDSNKFVDEDGFITVEYKGKKSIKCVIPPELQAQCQQLETTNGVFDEKKFESMVEDVRNSNFFMNFKENMLCALKNLDRNVESDSHENFIQNVETLSMNNNKMLDIVCYGLGNFASCLAARYQLAFLINLKKILLPRNICIFDPMFSYEEKRVLKNFGLTVLKENEEGKRTVLNRTIFFMPHCSIVLYNNLLWANWGKDSLSKLIIIGNSLQGYFDGWTENFFELEAVYINYASKFVTEAKIVNNFKFLDVFNTSSLHYFHIDALNEVSVKIWNDNIEPIYDDIETLKNGYF
ncbi:SRR1-like protein [Argiope bruennichi]|uniref:SRR1-like protein like n=1 Tax=Argiope bruennichi TaxID=94029 RepID=A0A8T0EUL0_ARGBR|nr:SRR1-like protein [Argiope bruennichi]KAF8781424.1 SRR1-like protein like [Argiope bruennichi]